MKKRFLAALLCLCLLVGLVPGMGTTAFAASDHNIGDIVTFAGYDWYIIGTETQGVKAPSGCYTLFAKNNDFGSTTFRAGAIRDDSTANYYKNSDLQKKMEEIANGFSDDDKNNIVARDTLDNIAGDTVSNQLVWPIGMQGQPDNPGGVNGEAALIDQSIRKFDQNYWTRTNYNDPRSGLHYAFGINNDGSSTYDSWGVLGALASEVTETFAVRPALYVKAEALDDDPPIVIPGTKFTLQPQTQYAVEGGSITFTAKAEAAGAEITETGKYKWQAQLPGSEIWYDMQMWNGEISFPYFGQTLTILNVSGTFTDNRLVIPEGNGTLVKDCLFRCVADGGMVGTAYSEPGNIIVVAGGGSQGGEDGREVELRTNEETRQIQWRYVGEDDNAWRDLVALDAITGGDGADGADGREVELQVANGYIQWRYTTGADTDWKNLMPLSDLKGEDGEDGREVELKNDGSSILWRYVGEGDDAWRPLVDLSDITGSDGADGKQVELRVEGGYIQWKYDADSDWQNLIALSALQGIKGDKGDKGDPGEDGDTPYIGDNGNWWIGGVDTGIKAEGSDGADGSDGSDGKDGQDGKDGEDGKDGLTPYIGSNGNWWIGTTDTGIKAAGVNGADGKDGKDGINGKDGANGKNGANGKDGADGVGIADIKLNENGELIVTLTDGTEKNLGKVKGEDGVGISGVSINENGELIVTLTDGTELNAGAVPTTGADDSNLKTLVYVSVGTAGVSLAGLIGLLAFLLTKRKSLIGK